MKYAEIAQSAGYQTGSLLAGDIAVRHKPRRSRTGSFYLTFGKRAFDICASLLILPVILPVITLVWCLVRLDGGQGFFGHVRVGQNGRKFRCWKVRTMVPQAEEVLQAYLAANPEAAAEWARDHKLANDPRITRLGRLLRKSSLDELPQILNVLRGEMSLVGPRPIVTDEIEKYGRYQSGYLAMKPGVTGMWQVSGRNDVSYRERVLLDMDYLAQRSFWLDLRVIFATVAVLFAWTGK